MKTNITRALALSALLLASGLSLQAQTSPVGTWDCISGGSGQQGICFITFSNDFTFGGFEILVSKKSGATAIDGRPGALDPERGGTGESSGGSTNTVEVTPIFGFSALRGVWGFDIKGRVIGSFPRIITGESTNNVSFVGKVKLGSKPRLTLVASSINGPMTYRGVTFEALTDVSGQWQGTKKVDLQSFVEFFTLSGSAFPNLYVMDGFAGNYSYTGGAAMVSKQKRMGFVVLEVPEGETNSFLRASVGPYKSSQTFFVKEAKTKGNLEPLSDVKFNASPMVLPVP